jgi:hypothetical protein
MPEKLYAGDLVRGEELISYGDPIKWLGAKAVFVGLYPPLAIISFNDTLVLCNEDHIEKDGEDD